MSREQDLRDMLLFGEAYDKSKYMGGVRYFKNLTTEGIHDLLNHNFIEADECQNNSPTTQGFLEYMEEWPGYYAHGYAVSFDRSDVRVTIEGIAKEGVFIERSELIAFVERFRYADEFVVGDRNLRCWYD